MHMSVGFFRDRALRKHFVFELRCPLLSGLAPPPCALMDDWAACDAEAVVTALSLRYRFSRANAVQLLREQGILPQREAAVQEED